MNEDKAARYHRLKRRVAVASICWSAVLLAGLALTGASGSMRDVAHTMTLALRGGEQRGLDLGLYLFGLLALHEIGDGLLGFYSGFVLERRYGLSMQNAHGWLADRAKSFAIAFVLGGAAAALVYWTMGLTLGYWWLLSGALFAVLFAVLAALAPVLLIPLFYTIRPLSSDLLRARLLALAERAGARVLGAYTWGLGDKTRRANAALTGIGKTRRILVSDTMLAEYTDDEIEVVLAHELGHHVHGDIWKGLALEAALMVGGLFAAAQLLTASVGRFGVSAIDDIAGLPLLVLAAGGVSLAMTPAARALSRAHERRADRFALRLTGNPSAFVSAMRRLGAQNLAEEHPSRLVQVLFHSHPPLSERIAAANDFRG